MLVEPIHLPYETALANARKAWHEKRLGAQHHYDACLYRYPNSDHCCVIGASIPPDHRIVRESNGARVSNLLERLWLTTDDVLALQRLQRAHDRVVNAIGFTNERQRFLEEFKTLLGVS